MPNASVGPSESLPVTEETQAATTTSAMGHEFDPDPPIEFEQAAAALWDARRHLIAATIVAALVSGALAFSLPPYFTATASFLPPSSSQNSSSMLAGQLGALGASALLGGAAKSSNDVYVGILKSRSVADAIIARFSLMKIYKVKKLSKAEKILGQKSKFEIDPKSSIVSVEVTDNRPERARDLANAYLDELRLTNSKLALTENSQRRLFYEQQLSSEKDLLEDAEVDLKKTEEKTGLIAPAGQTASEIQSIAQLRAEISARMVQLTSLRQSSTDQNPEIIRLVAEVDGLRRQLETMQSGESHSKVGEIGASKVPEVALEYVRKEREVKYHEALFQIISRQYESARIDEAHDAPLLQVLDAAMLPDTKSGPPHMLITAGGMVMGFILSSIWILFRSRKEAP